MKIIVEKCRKCRECEEVCAVGAISEKDGVMEIDKSLCIECGCCMAVCPSAAIGID